MKKIFALVMSLVLIFSLGTVAFAYGSKPACDPCSTPCVDDCDKTKAAIAFTTDVVTNLAKGAANVAALITAQKADHVSDIVDAAVTAGVSLVADCETGKAVGDAVGNIVEGAMLHDGIKGAAITKGVADTVDHVVDAVTGTGHGTLPGFVPGSYTPGFVPGSFNPTHPVVCPTSPKAISALNPAHYLIANGVQNLVKLADKYCPLPLEKMAGVATATAFEIAHLVTADRMNGFYHFAHHFPTIPVGPTPVRPTPSVPATPVNPWFWNSGFPQAQHTSASTTADPVTTTSSPKTFDAGIALYVGLAVMGATGSAFVIGKKKDF